MKSLPIVWQRLVNSDGQTCGRCGGTFEGVLEAVEKLKVILRPLNIEPTVETKEIDSDAFRADPSQSNRIWISGKPIEEWLGAQVASSCCDSVCEGSDCRTIEVGNQAFEVIPSDLIIKAALIAASQLIGPEKSDSSCQCNTECCPD